ncbi:MAG: hypothetical protein IJW94_07075 [Oscillospiraceae bacterium]|nr:hypothetical protein [Oscillospiraceae bacterium]
MTGLETAKKQLALLEEKKKDLLLRIMEDYGLEDAAEAESAIDDEEISLEWEECRELDYADSSLRCQQMLVDALALLDSGDKKSVHNANKALETLVREARKIRKERTEDIQKAQEVISLMDEIIHVCDDHRQK